MITQIKIRKFQRTKMLDANALPRSMGSTHRSRSNPLGRDDSPSCQIGNILASRALVLMLLSSALGVWWVLEQPSTSCMEYHPLFQALLRLVTVRKKRVLVSQFGAPTKKPTFLYSSDSVPQMVLLLGWSP